MKTANKQSNLLVVYYSKSGTTKKVAEAISELTSCDVEEVYRKNEMKGLLGYARLLFEAWVGVAPDIETPRLDPSQYRAVIIGSPVWGNHMASPLRTYLIRNAGKFKSAAYFVTFENSGNKEVIRQMEGMCERHGIAKLSLKKSEVGNGSHLLKIRSFISKIGETVKDIRELKSVDTKDISESPSAVAART